MAIDIEYFERLYNEAIDLWDRAEKMVVWNIYESMTPDKILYEKVPKSVRFCPPLG